MRFVIVAIACSREKSLARLLRSLANADYGNESVDLIVSIDKSENQSEVACVADSFEWAYGRKLVLIREKREGLKAHVFACGDLASGYEAMIMLEDDIVVSPGFFAFASQAIEYYKDDGRIAGVSLYKHETHTGTFRPFAPLKGEGDAFCMKFAQSWGQCWTRKMWGDFRDWYKERAGLILESDSDVPSYILSWNEQSWLKHFMRYLANTDKYFIYPYWSFSTNASEIGEHNKQANNDFQVNLCWQNGESDFNFQPFDSLVKYDMYYERVGLDCALTRMFDGQLLFDLNGSRQSFGDADYAVSVVSMPYKVVLSMALAYRPIELNCCFLPEGKDIRVYDLSQRAECVEQDNTALTRYDVRSIAWRRLLSLGFKECFNLIKRRLGFVAR